MASQVTSITMKNIQTHVIPGTCSYSKEFLIKQAYWVEVERPGRNKPVKNLCYELKLALQQAKMYIILFSR